MPKHGSKGAVLATLQTDGFPELRLTHEEIAKRSKLPGSAVTGIISGGLQKVTFDRVLRLVEAVGFVPQLKLTKAAYEAANQ